MTQVLPRRSWRAFPRVFRTQLAVALREGAFPDIIKSNRKGHEFPVGLNQV